MHRLPTLVLVYLLLLSVSAFAQMSRFQGTWDNIESEPNGLSRVIIKGKTIHLFGTCELKPCDLGTVKATSVFSLSEKAVTSLHAVKADKLFTAFLEITPETPDALKVTMQTTPKNVPGQVRTTKISGVFRRNATSPSTP